MRRAHHLVAVVAAVAIATPLSASAATSSTHTGHDVVDPPGEITLPAAYPTDLTRLAQVVGTSAGFAWQANNYVDGQENLAVHYSTYGGVQNAVAGGASDGLFTLQGSQLRLAAWSLDGRTPVSAPAVDISTGNRIASPAYNGGVWSTGDGALGRAENNNSGTYDFVLTNSAGTVVQTYQPVMFDGTDSLADSIDVMAADADGAVISFFGERGSIDSPTRYQTLDYLDFATGDYTVLDGDTDAPDAVVALSPDDIVWTLSNDGGKAFYVPRSTPSATPAAAEPDGHIWNLALNGDQLAYTVVTRTASGDPIDESHTSTVKTGALGGTMFTAVTGLPALGPVMPADNGDFAMVAGNDVANYGIYRLHPGSSSLSEPLAIFGPTAPLGIDASAGRILSVIPTTSHPVEQTQLAASARTVSAGHSAQLITKTSASLAPDPSGGNTAYIELTSTATYAVVLNGKTVVGRFKVPDGSYSATLSDGMLLVPHFANANTPKAGGEAIDVTDGAVTKVPESAALYGGVESSIGTGGIHQLTIATGADTLIPDSSGCTGDPQHTVLESDGDWVFCDTEAGNDAMAFNIRTGQHIAVPVTATVYNDQAVSDVLLANGLVAWIDASSRSVNLYNLSTQTDDVVGTAYAHVTGHQYLALNEDLVAWVADDNTTRVFPLGADDADAPRYLGMIGATSMTARAKGAAGTFHPQIDIDRPLTHWTMTIRNARRHVVRVLRGAAPEGGVRPVWNGRTSHGKQLPTGKYRWTVTGRGRTGTLRRSNGKQLAVTGSIHIVAKHHSHRHSRYLLRS